MAEEKLSEQKCVPCEGGASPLTREEAEEYLATLQGARWKLSDDAKSLEGEFAFYDGANWNAKWQKGVAFVQKLGELAGKEDHHPTIVTLYAKKDGGLVKVKYSTHAIGGLSKNDFIMAAKLNEAYQGLSANFGA